MKRIMAVMAIVAFTASAPFTSIGEDKADSSSKYKELNYDELKASAKDYKNKKVCFNVTFYGMAVYFPPILEGMGFKADKYYRLKTNKGDMIDDSGVPIFAKKTKDNSSLASIKVLSEIKVSGKLKKFPIQPGSHASAFPNYYIEADSVEVVKEGVDKEELEKRWKERRNRRLRNE